MAYNNERPFSFLLLFLYPPFLILLIVNLVLLTLYYTLSGL